MVTLGGRRIGHGEPCFIVAEAGVNHNGDLTLARQLVVAAAEAGADAVKFQAFHADEVASPEAPKAGYQVRATPRCESQLEMLRTLELDADALAELKALAEEHELIFLASAFDERSVEVLDQLGVAAFKIASGEITNHPLLAAIGACRRPVILSSGASDLEETKAAMDVLRKAGALDVVVLHCTTAYPAEAKDANLRALETLRDRLEVPVGYSDHTDGDETALAAVALGACVLEKHFTLDRTFAGPDHSTSVEPGDLAQMVRRIRRVEAALGDGVKRPGATERSNAAAVRRSLAASRDIPAGSLLTSAMLTALRPGTGISPTRIDEVIGRRLRRGLAQHQLLDPTDLE